MRHLAGDGDGVVSGRDRAGHCASGHRAGRGASRPYRAGDPRQAQYLPGRLRTEAQRADRRRTHDPARRAQRRRAAGDDADTQARCRRSPSLRCPAAPAGWVSGESSRSTASRCSTRLGALNATLAAGLREDYARARGMLAESARFQPRRAAHHRPAQPAARGPAGAACRPVLGARRRHRADPRAITRSKLVFVENVTPTIIRHRTAATCAAS